MTDGIDAFADWAADVSLDDAPEDVVRLAEAQVANQCGGALAARPNDGDPLVAAMARDAPDGDCTLLTCGTTDPASAIAVNATLGMLHDNDDYQFMAHAGQSAVFASLALAEHHDRSADALLRGVIVADELAGRLGASTLIGPHNGQMWAHVHAAATAAVTALLATGDADGAVGDRAGTAEALADAVRHALYNPTFPTEPGFMGGESKALTATAPALAGYRAGQLALGGGRGGPDALTGDNGFLDRFSFLPFPEMLTGWGTSWATRTLCFKPLPGCAYMQAPMEAFHEALGDRELDADEIASIEVGGSLPTIVMEEVSRPHRTADHVTPVNATFSVPYSLAAGIKAADRGEGGYGDAALTREALERDLGDLHQVADSVDVRHSWDHTAALLDGVSAGFDARAMIGERSLSETLAGLRTFRKEHARLSTAREVGRLVGGRNVRDVLSGLSPDERWPEGDLRHADFDAVRFDFGASVTVETTDGEELAADVAAHDGACGDAVEERREVVEAKLQDAVAPPAYREAAEDLSAVVMDLEGRDLDELGEAVRAAAEEFQSS